MPSGGTFTVGIEPLGADWKLSFADSGTGMSPQQIEKIFEPFQSEFEGGTGLGLAIVYQIVQAHEGKVWARSKPGQGSVFVLRLRRAAASNVSTAAGKGSTSRALAASSKSTAVAAALGETVHG